MPRPATKVNYTIKLIEEIKKNRCLYDPSSNRRLQKDLAWNSIAVNMKTSVEKCKSRWQLMRCYYSNHYISPISEAEKELKFSFYKYMKFLEPFMKPKVLTEPKTTVQNTSNSSKENDRGTHDRSFDLKLINEVKNHPILHKNNNVDSENTTSAWEKVSIEMNSPTLNCKEQWNRLRQEFIKFHQSKSNEIHQLWNNMDFLLPHIENEIEIDDNSTCNNAELDEYTLKQAVKQITKKHDCGSNVVWCNDVQVKCRKRFLLSLTEDMKQMSEAAERRFKQRFAYLVDTVLQTPKY